MDLFCLEHAVVFDAAHTSLTLVAVCDRVPTAEMLGIERKPLKRSLRVVPPQST